MRRPIQYQIPQYQPLPGVQPPITVREFRGANTFDPLSIAENFFTDIRNMTTLDYPAISVRPGYTVLGAAIGTKVLGLGVWKDQELHAVFSDGTWRKWTGSAWSSALISGLDTSAMWSFTNYQGGEWDDINLVGCNGVDGLHRYDGSTVQTFGDAPEDANFVTTYQNRLWVASGKEIHACALDRPEDWQDFSGTQEDSYAKDMESTRGENINMISSGLTKLTIGMPNSLHEMYGGVPAEFTFQVITEDFGVLNNQSASTIGGILRFIHGKGIFEWMGGTIPSRSFSEIVGKYPVSSGNKASGADTTMQYFALGDKILVYDTRQEVQAWSVWDGISPTCFAVFKNDLYIGDAFGRVLKLGGQDDAGTPIEAYMITKPFTAPSVAQLQRWLKMWTVWELAEGSELKVSVSNTVDGNEWDELASVTGEGLGATRIMVPVHKLTLEKTVRIRFDITGWGRMHEYTRHVRFLPMH